MVQGSLLEIEHLIRECLERPARPGELRPMVRFSVLSLWQPWASLIMAGVKVHETRSWPPPGWLLGRRLAIHATATSPQKAISEELHALCRWHLGRNYWRELPRGAVLGTVLVGRGVRTHDAKPASDADLIAGDWREDRWAWPCSDPQPFPVSIEARGRQRLWQITVEL